MRWIILSCTFLFFNLSRPSAASILRADSQWIKDSCGRIVILHGVNLSGANKSPDPQKGKFFPIWLSAETFKTIASFGFNSVRLLIIWEALEPERGKYNQEYIEEIHEKVKWAEEAGLWVILDMHQDVYSRCKFYGDGAPCWAVMDDGLPFKDSGNWYMNYLQPAVLRSFDNFWKNKEEIQNHFIQAWVKVASYFQDNETVAGYDLLNEPFPGSLYLNNDLFDKSFIQPFYEEIIKQIRRVDQNHIIFLEPNAVRTNVLAPRGFPSAWKPFPFNNLVLAPHFYDPVVTMKVRYDKDKTRLAQAMQVLKEESSRLNLPVWMGEFSVWGDYMLENGDAFLRDQLSAFNEAFMGWAFWDYDESAKNFPFDKSSKWKWLRETLSFPYPSCLAGKPLQFHQDFSAGTLRIVHEKPESTCDTEIRYPNALVNKISVVVNENEADPFTVKPGTFLISNDGKKARYEVRVKIVP